MTDKPILFVGDNPDDVALTLRALRQDNILNQVVIARDGVEALDYSFGTGVHQGRNADDKPALVLLDLKPPKVDGLEVIVRSERSNARGCSRWSSSPPPSRRAISSTRTNWVPTPMCASLSVSSDSPRLFVSSDRYGWC